ncbi:hypothetical protein NBRC111894_4705 [Sporolactobacillus inulinus]|uniref:Uncharacterized protein n=1 Tax=Sporolactobacillus inulinus TaxID=2078 RepID=A0A4Y1ZJH6_9BACL|nr:hypothetical protein NBRC111894_4705 [Sporolactobacillus inulinus]
MDDGCSKDIAAIFPVSAVFIVTIQVNILIFLKKWERST